jgi:hypothetical protein
VSQGDGFKAADSDGSPDCDIGSIMSRCVKVAATQCASARQKEPKDFVAGNSDRQLFYSFIYMIDQAS